MGKNIYYLSLLLGMVFVSQAMERIEELVSPGARRDLEDVHSEQRSLTGNSYTGRQYVDRRELARQTRKKIAAEQDSPILESMQSLQRLVCMPSGEPEVDWHLPVDGDTELHAAIRRGDADGDDMLHVLLLHSKGAGINVCNKRGDTPLLLASQTSRSRYYTPTLLSYPLDVNVKNSAGFTALYYAIKNKDGDCADKLLQHGADPNFVDEDGNTLFHIASQSDASDAAGCFVRPKRYALNPNQLNKQGLAPLHIAIVKKFTHMVRFMLLYAKADPNVPMAGESPLIFAIRNEFVNIIGDLVQSGADVNAKDAIGNSALDLALTRCNNTFIMRELLRAKAGSGAKNVGDNALLVCAIKNNDADAVRTLVECGVDPEIPDANGVVPIFHALEKRDVDLLWALFKHGANPNIKDANGETLLVRAIKNNDADAVRTLVECGADSNMPDANGIMPIFHALEQRDVDSLRVLLSHGVNPDIIYANSETPLVHAVKNKDIALADVLLSHGAKPDAKDANGESLLVHAVKNKDRALADALLSHGANPDTKDANGNTPLAIAFNNNDTHMAWDLICHGANPNMPDARGVTPISHALRLDDVSAAVRLVDKGARLDVCDAEGNTPLHLAVKFANLVSLMITKGARVDAVNMYGDTPLHCVESIAPITAYLLRLYGANINQKNKAGLTPYEKAIDYCQRGGGLDGRLLRILEPPRSYGLIGWISGEQPKETYLGSAESYGITLAHLPGMQLDDTQAFNLVVPGKDSRIECLDDEPGTTVPRVSEGAGRLSRGNVLSDTVNICGQLGSILWEQATACFYPWVHTAEQAHDGRQQPSISGGAAVSPESIVGQDPASSANTGPQDPAESLVNFDEPPATQSAGTVFSRHRFLAQSRP